MTKRKKRLKIAIISTLILLGVIVGGFYIYTLDYYRAQDDVIQTISESSGMIETKGNLTIIYPEEHKDLGVGFIFYPGGKVEHTAYIPLLKKLADEGVTCVLVKMPMNLAVFNVKGARKVYEEVQGIENWYISGHSLGGAMASSYTNKNSDLLEGIILLGAYPISDADIDTLVVYGSEDEGLDLEKLEDVENKIEIKGGNHAYFGNYGEQEGDGVATISREQQQQIALEEIMRFILR